MSAVHISKMNGKLDGFRAISTNTVTNPFCVKMNKANEDVICSHCYSHTMLNTYRKNMQDALQRNSDLLSTSVLSEKDLPTILDAYFRFSAHGELINQIHLHNLVLIVKHNPHCNFALWTKRKDLIAQYFSLNEKPVNLILIYSNPRISNVLNTPPKYFDRTFNNVLEHEQVERQNCTGQQCKNCLLCYVPNNGVTTIVEKVKKY